MKFFGLGLFILLTVSCDKQPSGVREAVLSPGQSVQATNKNGTIKISYVSPIKRRYEWDNSQRIVTLRARQEPFQGKLGIYEPADAWVLLPGKVRLVVDEAIRKFDTQEQIRAALTETSSYMDWVYTADGLVVGFGRTPSRKQINIDLFQFLLRGQKPTGLAGARADQIRLTEVK